MGAPSRRRHHAEARPGISGDAKKFVSTASTRVSLATVIVLLRCQPKRDMAAGEGQHRQHIAKRYRSKARVALLGRALEREANRRGYRYLTRDAAIANGYADAIERAYLGRVLERRDHPSPYGRQRYLKIALRPPRSSVSKVCTRAAR
ncbi:MAG: hypothetical protein AUH85_12160 [Chloroflexi bacterium 13_1_40CM_4_68_4]|nr:MAG: hypothetical protein AUH85_12160 [Chloroflexi bacterium 13_1_40CM_4_68_4]